MSTIVKNIHILKDGVWRPISKVFHQGEWKKMKGIFYNGKWYEIQDQVISPDIYLYNWHTITNPKFAPEGWTSLSAEQGQYIEEYCDYFTLEGLKNNNHGISYRNTNGVVLHENKEFVNFWLKEKATYASSGRYFWYWLDTGYYRDNIYGQDSRDYRFGFTTILMKYSTTNPGTLVDYEGNIYTTVKFGNYIFTVEPWKCKYLNDGTEIPYVVNSLVWESLTGMGMCGYNISNHRVC